MMTVDGLTQAQATIGRLTLDLYVELANLEYAGFADHATTELHIAVAKYREGIRGDK